jgi:hypothetical protein
MFKKISGSTWALLLIGLLAALANVLQAQRQVPIGDWAYVTENAYRISLGQTPYVDVYLLTTPGTYVVQALLMMVFGEFAVIQFVFTAVMAFLVVLLTGSILRKIVDDSWLSVVLCLPLTFGIYVIFPFPWYDNEAIVVCLVAFRYLLFAESRQFKYRDVYILGCLAALSFFFKQNIGAMFILSLSLVLVYGLKIGVPGLSIKKVPIYIAGLASPTLLFLAWVSSAGGIAGLESAFYWIFTNARRAKKIALLDQLTQVYSWPTLLAYSLTTVVLLWLRRKKNDFSFFSMSAIFLFLFASFFILKNIELEYVFASVGHYKSWGGILALTLISSGLAIVKKPLSINEKFQLSLFGIVLLVSHGTILSQGIYGSTFALWPFLSICMALLYVSAGRFLDSGSVRKWLSGFCVFLTLSMACSVVKNERFAFIRGSYGPSSAKSKRLAPLSTPGPWIGEMERVYRFIEDEVPAGDSMVALPGEDPFCFATRRKPVLPLFQMHPFAIPYEDTWVIERCMERDVKWLLIKNLTQARSYMPLDRTRDYVQKHYDVYKRFPPIYTLYKKKP